MSADPTPSLRQHMQRLAADGIDVVRVTYPDLIGTDRARDVLLDHLPSACDHGLAFCRAVYHTSPQGDVVPVAGGLDAGLPDITVRPDLDTLVPLPWEPGVASCLGDVTDPATGLPAPESPRDLLRTVLDPMCRTRPASGRRPRARVLPLRRGPRPPRAAGGATRAPPASSTPPVCAPTATTTCCARCVCCATWASA